MLYVAFLLNAFFMKGIKNWHRRNLKDHNLVSENLKEPSLQEKEKVLFSIPLLISIQSCAQINKISIRRFRTSANWWCSE